MTSKLTRERIELIANFHRAMTLPPSHAEIEELARMMLAAMDREPVAWIVHARTGDQLTTDGSYVANAEGILGLHSTPLYRHAQPAPVVPDEKPMPNPLSMYAVDAVAAIAEVKGWNACRATMLQGKADGTLTNEGTKQAGNSPAIGVDLASGPDCSVEVRYVAPPGYAMVPKEPTEEMLQASYREAAVYSPTTYRAMIAAAPQSPGSEHATVPGRWIPVSERMPEPGILVLVYTPPQPDDYPGDVRIGFDYIDPDGDDPTYWFNHAENYEHFYCVACDGMTGPSEKAPYTHWIPLPAAPQEVKGE